MIDCGFTGTRTGMTSDQKIRLDGLLINEDAFEILRHGDCVGADEQAHKIAQLHGLAIIIHPPIDPKFRAYCKGNFVAWREEKDYLQRNRDIVNESEFLIATPNEFKEQKKGGTWYTIRYAKLQGKPGIIIWPDGSSKEF